MDFQFLQRGINYPYVVISDVHLHNWSAFSHTNERGVNNRLQQILDGIEEAVTALLAQGGNDLVITGDLFHTRGKLAPSVFNPTFNLFVKLSLQGIRVHFIPGNHDLEGKTCDSLGNAVATLSTIPNFFVYDKPTIVDERFLFIPWEEDSKEVLNIANKGTTLFPNLTVFCHVGLSGVIKSNIGNVINVDNLLSKDFKYVFSGHFHNHVSFDSRVFSVGALTHQTWGDIGSRAGYLVVFENKVKQRETTAPKFVEGSSEVIVKDNYLRLKGEMTEEQAEFAKWTAKGLGVIAIQDLSTRPTIIEKKTVKAVDIDLGLDAAIEAFCRNTFGGMSDEILKEAKEIMSAI